MPSTIRTSTWSWRRAIARTGIATVRRTDRRMELRGSCHCGNLRYTLAWPGEPAAVPARACTCGFCTRHGAAWTAHPDAMLSIEVADAAALSRYTFETETAEFLVCTRCGGVPACTSRIDGRDYAVVNVNTFDDPAIRIEQAPVSFDGEAATDRLVRRQQRWIGTVRFGT
jgi:hypothetical protein